MCVSVVASLTGEWQHKVLLIMLMEQQTVTNPMVCVPWHQQCMFAQAHTLMINHLTSYIQGTCMHIEAKVCPYCNFRNEEKEAMWCMYWMLTRELWCVQVLPWYACVWWSGSKKAEMYKATIHRYNLVSPNYPVHWRLMFGCTIQALTRLSVQVDNHSSKMIEVCTISVSTDYAM